MQDNHRLDGKVAVITGAGGEIGAATIRLLASRGAHIVAVDCNTRALEQLAPTLSSGPPYLRIVADVTDEGAVAAYVEQARALMGRIDILRDVGNSLGDELFRPLQHVIDRRTGGNSWSSPRTRTAIRPETLI